MTINPLIYYSQYTDGFKKIYANNPVDHGWDHIVNVVLNARIICAENNIQYNREIELGAVFHDMGNAYSRDNHHIISARMVPDVLSDLGIPTDDLDVELIQKCCRYHRASEKEDVTQMEIEVQVVSAADRMKPSTNIEDLMEDVVWRAVQYSMTHSEEEEVEDTSDPVYSAYRWIKDTLSTDNNTRIYSDIYRNAFGSQLSKQTDLVDKLSLEFTRKWCSLNKGVGSQITLS